MKKNLAQNKVFNSGKIEGKVEYTLFYKYKSLDFGIKFKELRTKPGLLSHRT